MTRNPLVVFRAIADPPNQVLEVRLADFLVIDDLVHEKLLRIFAADRSRFFQGTGRIFEVIILFERFDVGSVEGGEDVGGVGNISNVTVEAAS